MPPSHLLTPDCIGTGDTCFLCFAGRWKSGHPHPRPSPEGLTQSALSFQVLQRPTGRPSWGESMSGPDAGSDCPPSSLPSPCLSFLTCEMGEGYCLLSRLAARPGGQGAGIWGPQGGDQVLSQPQHGDIKLPGDFGKKLLVFFECPPCPGPRDGQDKGGPAMCPAMDREPHCQKRHRRPSPGRYCLL